jgi:2-succinyl-5-enolpyruvyl-6-hydroxy-3-cyclohexene-1-carboxylate synthase
MDINAFLKLLLNQSIPVASNYKPNWEQVKVRYQKKRKKYLEESPFSDLVAFSAILPGIPGGYQVQLANSSTVRYTQLFDMDGSLRVFCNRGTSGIDGSTSTSIGASVYDTSPTVLITGDLSFLYDSNALWNGYMRTDFRIILINNGGGGIFRILPGKEETENFKNFFETVQQFDMEKLCEFYGLAHIQVSDRKDLKAALSGFYRPGDTPRVLEIITPRLINDKVLLGYFDFIT